MKTLVVKSRITLKMRKKHKLSNRFLWDDSKKGFGDRKTCYGLGISVQFKLSNGHGLFFLDFVFNSSRYFLVVCTIYIRDMM